MTHTIKRFLVLYITLAVVIVYGLISFVSYAVSKDELDELYDANLQQVAHTIVAQHQAVNVISDLYRPAQINATQKKNKAKKK